MSWPPAGLGRLGAAKILRGPILLLEHVPSATSSPLDKHLSRSSVLGPRLPNPRDGLNFQTATRFHRSTASFRGSRRGPERRAGACPDFPWAKSSDDRSRAEEGRGGRRGSVCPFPSDCGACQFSRDDAKRGAFGILLNGVSLLGPAISEPNQAHGRRGQAVASGWSSFMPVFTGPTSGWSRTVPLDQSRPCIGRWPVR